MSHHFDIKPPPEDISDVFCFAGPSDDDGPRTVIGMNASPNGGAPWDSNTFYELKLDLNDDLVEEITWRFTFSQADADGNQTMQVAQLTGADATNRAARGKIIVGPGAPTGKIYEVKGVKIFADKRLDSFFTDIRVPFNVRGVLPPGPNAKIQLPTADPHLYDLGPKFTDTFAGQIVRTVIIELPARITGLDPIQCWGTTAFGDQAHGWTQVQRAAIPDVSVVFDNGGDPYLTTINSTAPSADLAGRPANPETDPAGPGVWGTIRDQVAAVVKQLGTYNQGVNGKATPMAYGAWAADTLLPNVLRFTPGTHAKWDAWNGIKNGKGLHEELASNFAKVIINQDFTTGLKQTEQLKPYFPYLLAPPPDS